MSFITVTGVLTNPSGAVLPNYNILFEAIRTSDTVINNTDVLIVTNSSGGYSFELGYGTYTLKIKSGREARYSTVASNILIYSTGLNNNSIQQIILAQEGLEDINIELIDQFLQIRADVLLNAQNASTSETNAAASAASALTSKNAAAASATSASSSAATATTKASEAASSATSASSSAATASTSATSALASKNAAATSETNAAASAAAASTSKQQAAIYAASLAGGIVENGGVNLSSGVAPTPMPDGLGGYISTLWKVTVAGTVNSISYAVGDSIVYSKALNDYYKIDSTDQVTSVNGMSGAVNITSITGNAGTATKLATAKSISTSGDITWSVSFDGSANVTAAATLATVATPGTYNSVTVDAKGRVISGTNPSILATEEEVVARIEATKAVTPATLNAVVPYSPNINPTLDLDFANQVYRHFEGPDGLVSHPLTPFVTFTRSSIATFFDAMGVMKSAAVDTPRIDYDPVTGECKGLLVEEQRTNLLLNSTDLSKWPVTNAAAYITASTVLSPAGDLRAYTLWESAGTSNVHQVYQNVSLTDSTQYTASVYAKKGGFDSFSLRPTLKDGSQVNVSFNLTTGTVSPGAGCTGTMTLVAGGWYLCTASFNALTGASSTILRIKSNNDSTGIGTNSIHLYGPQLEAGSFPTSYIPTPAVFTGRASTKTYFDSNGVLQTAANDVAVTDHGYVDGRWVSKGLSLEPQATNLVLQSQNFSGWGVTAASISGAKTTAPDGTVSGTTLTPDAAATLNSYTTQLYFGAYDGTQKTFSAFVKSNGLNQVRLRMVDNSTSVSTSIVVNLTDGSIFTAPVSSASWTGVNGSVTPVSNGWYRITVTGTGVGGGTVTAGILPYDSVLTTGDGVKGLYIWGAQLETGPVATSYIPTTTAQVTRAADTSTSAQATRAADDAVISGANFSQWYKQYEGTIGGSVVLADVSREYDLLDNYRGVACLSDGTTNNRIRLGSVLTKASLVIKSGVEQANIAVGSSVIGRSNLALSFKTDSVIAVKDGVVGTQDASAAIPIVTQLSIGRSSISAGCLCGHLRSLKYYPKALASAELQAMTA